jgi:hypothetical protein
MNALQARSECRRTDRIECQIDATTISWGPLTSDEQVFFLIYDNDEPDRAID